MKVGEKSFFCSNCRCKGSFLGRVYEKSHEGYKSRVECSSCQFSFEIEEERGLKYPGRKNYRFLCERGYKVLRENHTGKALRVKITKEGISKPTTVILVGTALDGTMLICYEQKRSNNLFFPQPNIQNIEKPSCYGPTIPQTSLPPSYFPGNELEPIFPSWDC